jgi:hypothetical protein
LALRPELTTPLLVGKGIDFVGWKTWWNRCVSRPRTLSTVRAKLDAFERGAVHPVSQGRAQRIDLRRQDAAGSVGRLQSTLTSYAGHLRHGATQRVWTAIWEQYPWLSALFERRGWVLIERWSRRHTDRARDFRSQYWSLARHAGNDCLIFFPVGRFIEFYGPQRMVAARELELHTVALPRAGYAFTVGFPTRLSSLYTAHAVRQGLNVVEVHQAPALLGRGCIPRLPSAVIIPVPTRHPRVSAVALGYLQLVEA